jgi:uncharacterized protein
MKYLIIAITLLLLVACQRQAEIANPAAVYCLEIGGQIEIVADEAGERGICVLQEGTRCDEWDLFRGECAECATCPLYTPPPPGWCNDGVIVPAEPDDCGCIGPPSCEPA